MPPARSPHPVDESFRLRAEGYDFLPSRGLRRGRRWFETRLMLRKAVCLGGGDAPEVLYAPGRFTRVGSLPPTTLRLLQDVQSVNQLDGAAHRRRKAAFLNLLSAEASREVSSRFLDAWRRRMTRGGRIVLLPEVERMLCGAALNWMGAPTQTPRGLNRRTREFSAMVGLAGATDLRVMRALWLREKSERWMRSLVRQARREPASDATPLHTIARWTDDKGRLLPVKTAAVELINLARPIVAVARYVVFAADALRRHPEWRDRLAQAGERELDAFAHEVRRVYPFFPAVGGRVLTAFDWEGRSFEPGEWVLADLHGANHDPERWSRPGEFYPDRFLRDGADPDRVTAQGAGDPSLGHRCPGERMTLEIIKASARELAVLEFRLPRQDFRLDMARLPTAPRSGYVIDLGSEAETPPDRTDRLPSATAQAAANGLAGAFAGLGVGILLAPRLASRLFGLPRSDDASRPYIQALAFRDLSLASILGLSAATSRRGLRSASLGAAIIPVLDAWLVNRRRGRRAAPSLAVHLISGAALLALSHACRVQRQTRS